MPNPTYPGYVNNFQSNEGVLPVRQTNWGYNIDYNINDKQSIHWSEWRDKQTSYATETGSHLLGELGSETGQPGSWDGVPVELLQCDHSAPGDDRSAQAGWAS